MGCVTVYVKERKYNRYGWHMYLQMLGTSLEGDTLMRMYMEGKPRENMALAMKKPGAGLPWEGSGRVGDRGKGLLF